MVKSAAKGQCKLGSGFKPPGPAKAIILHFNQPKTAEGDWEAAGGNQLKRHGRTKCNWHANWFLVPKI